MQEKGITIDEVVDAKKQTLPAEAVWRLLTAAEQVHVASGQNILSYRPGPQNREELLSKATGRSGNLRAPALVVGSQMLVGYNAALYERYL